MEDVLAADLRVLENMCRLRGIDRDSWHCVPAFARVWETYAADILTERLHLDGKSMEAAKHEAARVLGLEIKTLESRRARWYEDAIRRAA